MIKLKCTVFYTYIQNTGQQPHVVLRTKNQKGLILYMLYVYGPLDPTSPDLHNLIMLLLHGSQ